MYSKLLLHAGAMSSTSAADLEVLAPTNETLDEFLKEAPATTTATETAGLLSSQGNLL